MKKNFTTTLFVLASLMGLEASAQNTSSDIAKLDSLSQQTLELAEQNQKKINLLEQDFGSWGNLKMSGYAHFQWQLADGKGAPAFTDGGSFPLQSNNRFMVRRGRIKFTYKVGFATVVFQPDFTEKKVGIKDVYVKLQSNNKLWGGQVGFFDRPFGYEISYSSSKRESVERSRLFNSLFPGERDLGAMATFSPGDFTINAGLFNGTGVASEDDSRKDFIGRVAWLKDINKDLQLGAAFSYYNGGILTGAEKHYVTNPEGGFQAEKNEMFTEYLRQYFGFGARILTDFGIGETNIRGEYIFGTQPGTFKNNNNPSGGFFYKSPGEPLYLRNFEGGYVIYAQTIGKSKHQVVFKYDFYDPNTKMKGKDAGHLDNTGAADLAYTTFGVGYNFQLNKNIRLMAYYDMVNNETTDVKIDQYIDYSERIKQNILTLRLQVKF